MCELAAPSVDFSLTVAYRDANADDEQHNDGHCEVSEAGLGDVEHRAVRLLLGQRSIARHTVEKVDRVQAKGADGEAAERSEDTRDYRDGFALMRIGRQIGQPGPVRHVHDGVAHTIQNVHHGCVNHQRGFILDAAGCKQQNEKDRVDERADHQPNTEFAVFGAGVVDDHAHDRVVDRIPDARRKEQDTDEGAAQAKRIGKIQHQECADQVANCIFTNRANTKRIFLPCRKPTGWGLVIHRFYLHISNQKCRN